jgi:hypothetical protein
MIATIHAAATPRVDLLLNLIGELAGFFRLGVMMDEI